MISKHYAKTIPEAVDSSEVGADEFCGRIRRMSFQIDNLISRIKSIGFDLDSDFPGLIQVDSARDGVMHFLEYDEDEDGFITTPPREYDGTFTDAIQAAIDCVISAIDIDGLSRDEAVTLLMSPAFREKTSELIRNTDGWGGLAINGTRFSLIDNKLVNEDFGEWPFADTTD